MKTRSPVKKLAAAVVAAGVLVGCTVSSPSTAPKAIAPAPVAELSGPAFELLVDDTKHSKMASEFLAKLALSEAQKTELKGVIKAAFEKMKPIQAALKPLVTGPEIDRTALSAAIKVAMQADAAQDAQTMEAVREILTPTQRKLLADKLKEMATSEDDPHMKIFEKLMDKAGAQVTMTATQREAFTQLKSAFMGFWTTNREAYMTAMAKHMEDGNEQELHQEFARLSETIPSDAMISFMASLDQSQRQTLIAWKEEWQNKIVSKL